MIQTISFFKSPEDILASADSSKSVEFVNTWDDWHIIASERPVFAPPEPKTYYTDLPGGNGSIDLSESLTGYPIYENREGSFTFKVMNDYEENGKYVYISNDTSAWAQRYSKIMEFLHGQRLYAVLSDDPTYFYTGRFSVSGWNSGDTWSEITLDYTLNPFKWNISSSISDWLWDPFNFETGVIWDAVCSNISIDSTEEYTEIKLPSSDFDASYTNAYFGTVPISPTIIFTDESDNKAGIYVRFVNSYLGIDETQHIKAGETFMPDFVFYGQTPPYSIYFKGKGKVSIDFRVGRL